MTTVTKYEIELDNNAEDEFEFEEAHEAMDDILCAEGVPYYFIEGHAMGWTRANGATVVRDYEALDALKVNGDYRIVLTVDPSNLTEFTAVRYSHDEPCGASFTIRPATEIELVDYGIIGE